MLTLVPDEVVNSILKKRLAYSDWKHMGLCLDGYPKTEEQIKFLQNELNFDVDLMIILEASDETIKRRSLNRKVDPESGLTYSEEEVLNLNNPSILNRLTAMTNQESSVLQERLKRWENLNIIFTNHFQKKIIRIDSDFSKKNVMEKLSHVLENYAFK